MTCISEAQHRDNPDSNDDNDGNYLPMGRSSVDIQVCIRQQLISTLVDKKHTGLVSAQYKSDKINNTWNMFLHQGNNQAHMSLYRFQIVILRHQHKTCNLILTHNSSTYEDILSTFWLFDNILARIPLRT